MITISHVEANAIRAIIPAAGRGTRLRPQTHTRPKSLLYVGSKPIIGHILDDLKKSGIDEVVMITGFQKKQLENYVKNNYDKDFKLSFVEQTERKGLGHAITYASKFLDGEPVLIVLGDSIYESSYKKFLDQFTKHEDWHAGLAVKPVKNPQHYGIVKTKEDSDEIIDLEEKPANPSSNLAITGIYIFRESNILNEVLQEMSINKEYGTGGELQLTDAIKKLLKERKQIIGAIPSGRWFDCGKKDTLLEANRFLLDREDTKPKADYINEKSTIINPVSIQQNTVIKNSIIGEYVSIGKNTIVENSIICNSIIGEGAHISNISLKNALVGNYTRVIGTSFEINIGDHSIISFNNGVKLEK